MRVLIVEDEPVIALELKDIAEEAGYVPVGPVTTLDQALALAPHADIALVDLGLSDGLSGATLARRLIDRFNIKVVFVTGSPRGVGNGLSGSTAVIAKPFTPDHVRDALEQAALAYNVPLQHSAQREGRPEALFASDVGREHRWG